MAVTVELYKRKVNEVRDKIRTSPSGKPTYDQLTMLYDLMYYMHNDFPGENKYVLNVTDYVKNWSNIRKIDDKHERLYWDTLLFQAPWNFESYVLFMERDRPFEKKFYEPRMKTLNVVAKDLQDLEDRKISFYGLSMPSRVGKALDYNTPVLTRNGWKKHGDLTILDEVIGIDGKYKKILAIHNPCEMEYEVTFSDGEKVICHGNHEWVVYNRHTQKIEKVETKKIYEKNTDLDGHKIYSIPIKESLIGDEKSLFVDPYTLGAWLGDGRNTNPDICGAESDHAIIDAIIENGYELAWDTKHKTTGVRYYGFKKLRKDLQKYGMCHSGKRTEKHIPDEYFTSSKRQRLELLAGLLDTDGSLRRKENRYDFTTNEEKLRDGFISLVSTFGWRCCVVRHEKGMSPSGIYANKPYWVVSFNPTEYIPCRLERKQLWKFSVQRRVTIESVVKISGHFGNCITVEDGIYCVGKTLKPTHNSSICIFFLSWIMGKRPNSHSAMGGHSGRLAKGFYGELLNLTSTKEYTFSEIFPNAKLERKSADDFEINFNDPDRFATMTCRGIDGTWTGAVDISEDGYLYVDDLVRDREHSLSPIRLENTYQEYLNKMVDRKNDGARELMVGTRWNVMDPLGRIEAQFKEDPRYRFRKIPALNENGESNFDYSVKGFSAAYYLDMKSKLDKNEWMAKFMQSPFVREGLLFPADELRFYNGVLPDGDSRRVSACDVAWGGGDSLSMPIGREYENGDVYIYDWVFNKGKKEETLPIVCGKIMGNEIHQINFEANNGGDMYCMYITEMLEKQKYKCSCTSTKAPGRMEKMAKIIAASGDIIRRFVFLDKQHRSEEYQAAMDELEIIVQIGINEHDDSADSLSQLVRFIDAPAPKPTEIINSPY